METVLDIINSGDIVSLIALIAVLCWVGARMIHRYPDLGQWASRFAAVAFIGYCLYMGSELDQDSPGVWFAIACRGVLAAGLTLGVSWIVLAVYGFMKSYSDRAARQAQSRASDRKRERERKQREREEQKRRELWEHDAPERERQRQIAEERRLQQEAVSREARQTREDTRYACELFYNLHAPKIADRFSKQDLHDFLNRYMGDSQTLDVIRRRANQLVETIRQHVEAVDPAEEITTLEELAGWYEKQKTHLEGLNVEPAIKREFCLQLNDRYTTLTERLLEEVKP
jgi:hypothetical protein